MAAGDLAEEGRKLESGGEARARVRTLKDGWGGESKWKRKNEVQTGELYVLATSAWAVR